MATVAGPLRLAGIGVCTSVGENAAVWPKAPGGAVGRIPRASRVHVAPETSRLPHLEQ
jgi:hypothetical protein